MSTLGKVFLIIVLVESIAFGVFSMALFSKRIIWRELYTRDIGEKNQKISNLNADIAKHLKEIEKINLKEKELNEKIITEQTKVTDGEEKLKEKANEIQLLKDKNKETVAESDKLKTDLETQRQSIVTLTDELSKKKVELTKLEADSRSYAKEISDAKMETERHRTTRHIAERRAQMLEKELDIERGVAQYCRSHHQQSITDIKELPRIDGHVTAVYLENEKLVMIDKGQKDGVTPNMQFVVYRDVRGGQYVGTLLIIHVYDNMAAGTMIIVAPDMKIQNGDSVTTKLQP